MNARMIPQHFTTGGHKFTRAGKPIAWNLLRARAAGFAYEGVGRAASPFAGLAETDEPGLRSELRR